MMKTIFKNFLSVAFLGVLATGCQKMDRPSLGDYPEDSNPPGGPLNFYVAFDGTTTNAAMNAVDSIRANFASDNPLTSIDGVRGKGVQGENRKFVKYAKPNDWAIAAQSFTVSTWFKKNGQTQNNNLTNGPEYLFSLKSNNGHWSGGNFLFFLEGNNTACAVKTMICDAGMRDNWMTWEGGNSIPNLCNNQWNHIAIVYNAANSSMTLYVNGVANPNVRTWAGHGNINISNSAITELRVGAGPQNNFNTDDWLSSSFKGGIDQFRMYSKALTAAEIQALFSGKE
jgi:hypothetical protein